VSAEEHGRAVLSAVIGSQRTDLLDLALRHLRPAHFTDPVQRTLFEMCDRYYDVTGAVLSRAALGDLCRAAKAQPGTALLYEEAFDALAAEHADEAALRWGMEQLADLAATRLTSEALSRSYEINTKGVTDDRGNAMMGHADARQYALAAFAQIDKELAAQDAPEGDMRTEGEELVRQYADREKHRALGDDRILTGISELDKRTGGGLERGLLALVIGFTGSGKSQICAQIGWRACTQQGKNVVIFTSETSRAQVRLRLIARHSRLEAFGLADGLNTRDLQAGTLPDEQKKTFAHVVRDFTSNPAYGSCYVAQMPKSATIGWVESKLVSIDRRFRPDLVIIDYLALLRAERKRSEAREELSQIIKDAQQLAVTWADGLGVPVISPWQVNRAGYDKARARGYYALEDTAETAEASNTPGLIIGLLPPAEVDGRRAEVKLSIVKNRAGERLGSLTLDADYGTCYFAERSSGTSYQNLMELEGSAL
jgi:replicative DNA helicase